MYLLGSFPFANHLLFVFLREFKITQTLYAHMNKSKKKINLDSTYEKK
jgi:hypothetical protein